MVDFYCHLKCSTCKKAEKWLNDHDVEYHKINIVENPPSEELLIKMMIDSKRSIKSFFNTSGQGYRELNLKDRVDKMDFKQAATLLSSDGMLIKRPLIYKKGKVLSGFKEEQYQNMFL